MFSFHLDPSTIVDDFNDDLLTADAYPGYEGFDSPPGRVTHPNPTNVSQPRHPPELSPLTAEELFAPHTNTKRWGLGQLPIRTPRKSLRIHKFLPRRRFTVVIKRGPAGNP